MSKMPTAKRKSSGIYLCNGHEIHIEKGDTCNSCGRKSYLFTICKNGEAVGTGKSEGYADHQIALKKARHFIGIIGTHKGGGV